MALGSVGSATGEKRHNCPQILGRRLKKLFCGKKATTSDQIREMAEAWLRGRNLEETARKASELIHVPGTYPGIWKFQLSDKVSTLQRKAQTGAGTKKIAIEPRATFRALREDESSCRSQITLRLLVSFTTERFVASAAEPVTFMRIAGTLITT